VLPTEADAPETLETRSKAAHRVAALASGVLGVPVEEGSPRIFCSLIPPNEKKVEALRWVAGGRGGGGFAAAA
jgi:hypothetical protein